MSRSSSRCAVILAAGESSRMGRDKALLPWPPPTGSTAPSSTLLSAAIERFSPYVDMVLVVAGKNAAALAPIVYANGASLVVNPRPERGQFSSLQVGLQDVLNRGRDAAMITLVDRPPVKPETIQALDEAFERAQHESKWAVVPEYQGEHGHPFIAGRELIEAFLKAPASSKACDIQHAHQDRIVYVALDDSLISTNIDTPEQYSALPPPQMVNSK